MGCLGHLQEGIFRKYQLEQLEKEKRRLETKRDCYRLASEIYAYLDAHPSSALNGKRITIIVPKLDSTRRFTPTTIKAKEDEEV